MDLPGAGEVSGRHCRAGCYLAGSSPPECIDIDNFKSAVIKLQPQVSELLMRSMTRLDRHPLAE